MKIDILCVGKIKEKFYVDAIAEYSKRLSRYITLNIIEVKDEKTPDHASVKEEDIIKGIEAEKLKKYISDNAYLVVLAIEGKQFSSEELSDFIVKKELSGISHIQFLIGGSLGVDDSIKKRADYLLSFSKMTFPHQLMRVVLLEQIYRSYKIKNKEPYHK